MESVVLINVFLLTLTLVLAFATILFLVWLAQSILFKAPFVPLPRTVVVKMCEMVDLKEGDQFYDLGSGDGRVVRSVARKFPANSCYGVEMALFPNLIALTKRYTSPQRNVSYLMKDFHRVPLQQVDTLFLYLWPSVMDDLAPKLKAELPASAQIISCRFTLPGFNLQSMKEVDHQGTKYKLYVYTNIKDNSVL